MKKVTCDFCGKPVSSDTTRKLNISLTSSDNKIYKRGLAEELKRPDCCEECLPKVRGFLNVFVMACRVKKIDNVQVGIGREGTFLAWATSILNR